MAGKTKRINIKSLAGLIDGDGGIDIKKGLGKCMIAPKYDLRLSLHNTHKLTMLTIQKEFGGHMIKRKGTKRPVYSLCWLCRQAEEILQRLRPFLIVKRRQAKLGLLFMERKGVPVNSKLPDDAIKFREKVYKLMQRLNASAKGGKGILVSPEYSAGFFDAEGSISILRSNRRKYKAKIAHNLAVQISNTNRSVIEAIQHLYGGSLTTPSLSHLKNLKQVFILSWRCGKAAEFLIRTIDKLSIKKRQATLGLLYWNKKDNCMGNPGGVPQKEIQFRDRIRMNICRLNAIRE